MRKILQSLFWQFHVLRKDKNLKRILKELKKNQYLSKDELEHLNWQKCKKIVSYAYENTSYYRKRYDKEGFHPNDLKEPDDFLKVPIITRNDIRNNLENMVADNINSNRLRTLGTGGTTGLSLKVYQDKNYDPLSNGLNRRVLEWGGISPWTDFACIYRVGKQDSISANRSDSNTPPKFFMKVLNTVKQKLTYPYRILKPRFLLLDASCMDKDSIEKFIADAKKTKPNYFWGYVGAIGALASYIEKKELIGVLKPKGVWVTSSPLSSNQRHHLNKVFNCPIYEQYGCVEVYYLAAECKAHQGLHALLDVVNLEFLDSNNALTEPNVTGNVVVTDFENYAAPIIRYLNGDLGSRKETICSCGIKLPLINKIKGRQTDNIILPDGSCIAGEYLTTIFDDYVEDVQKFQVHQVSLTELVIKVVMTDFSNYNNIKKNVENELNKRIKGQTSVKFMQVKDIKHDRGKFRYIISDADSQLNI